MQLSKFKILLVLISFIPFSIHAVFSERECLDSTFKVSVSHKNKITFGLVETKLFVEKDKCDIIIKHESYKFLKEGWKIDVCREPVHIKSGIDSVEVLKKQGRCPNKRSKDFCDGLSKIKEIIQDDGLVFAVGEKEDLATDHGRIHCSYELINSYLTSGKVFSRYARVEKLEPQTAPVKLKNENLEASSRSEIINKTDSSKVELKEFESKDAITDPVEPKRIGDGGESGSF